MRIVKIFKNFLLFLPSIAHTAEFYLIVIEVEPFSDAMDYNGCSQAIGDADIFNVPKYSDRLLICKKSCHV